METIEHFSGFLMKMGIPNFLVIGIVVIVVWLLISGLRKGIGINKKEDTESETNGEKNSKD
jgi:hypothetical protein